ncbi:class II fructose-bisphosphate aldolase [Paeniglutamicibacter sp. R2-26]|uniref:class II fructose-bisphosphate aldolase n=1 Tax=Paeniglutamicibacter sp. R2-26 TaxID=3144417 RepID=UPI003EE442E7
MPLVNTAEIMKAARAANIGQGAFNVIHLESAEALIRGAELAQTPVILQISENCVGYHGGLEPVALATLAAARNAGVPVAVHLDHAESEDLARAAVDLGFGSIMFDGAHLDYGQNVEATRRVTEYAHAAGVYVEAELGKIGGKDGAHAPGVRTDPAEALAFVGATGVDALAVAVGSSHAMLDRSAALDTDLIARIRAALEVPLVLHGSSGVSDENIVSAIDAGMTKINVSTHLNGFFTRAIRRYLEENPQVVDSRKYLALGRDAMAEETARLLALFAGKSL